MNIGSLSSQPGGTLFREEGRADSTSCPNYQNTTLLDELVSIPARCLFLPSTPVRLETMSVPAFKPVRYNLDRVPGFARNHASGIKYQEPGISYQVAEGYRLPRTRLQETATRYPIPVPKCQVPVTRYQIQVTSCQVSGYQMGISYQV